MGVLFSKLASVFEALSTGQPSRIVMLGLDAAGKTTILYKIKLNEKVSTIPTIGFNVETVSPAKGVSFTVWDVGGQEKIRRLWQYYYQDTDGLIFVVDSNDRERVSESREELFGILQTDEMRGVPACIIANKQDLPNAMSPAELIDKLGLRNLNGHKWHIHGACAVNGEGIYESMESLARLVKEFKKSGR